MHAYDDRKSIVIVLDEKILLVRFFSLSLNKITNTLSMTKEIEIKKYTKLAYDELVSLLTDDFVISLYSEIVKSAVLSNVESGT